MSVEALNCQCCGAALIVKGSVCECEYCGSTNIVCGESGKYVNMLNRANKLRQSCEFDRAFRLYDDILAQYRPAADILWAQTLCEYGIEYVQDPASHRYIPTLHRIKDESILNSRSFIDALELADPEQQERLKICAGQIATIQAQYLNIALNEQPYDVFICYKETDDETKKQTEDSGLALELYERLVNYGYKVFFSRVTLQDKIGVNYEPYIFAALKSSLVMVVIGTKPEYFNAIWVKNEWSRFLKLKENDINKQMFFACDYIDDLPRAFSQRQAQLLTEPNAIQNLAFNIKTYLSRIKAPVQVVQSVNNTDPETMYKIALNFYEQGKLTEAMQELNFLLKNFPNKAEAYWLRMLIRIGLPLKNTRDYQADFSQDNDYKQAIYWANGNLKTEYTEICEICKYNLTLQQDFNRKTKGFIGDFSKKAENKIESIDNNPTVKEIKKNKKKVKTKKVVEGVRLPLGLTLGIIAVIFELIWIGDYLYELWFDIPYYKDTLLKKMWWVFDSSLHSNEYYTSSDMKASSLYFFVGLLIASIPIIISVVLCFLHNKKINLILSLILIIHRGFWFVLFIIGMYTWWVNFILIFVVFDSLICLLLPQVMFPISYFSKLNHSKTYIKEKTQKSQELFDEIIPAINELITLIKDYDTGIGAIKQDCFNRKHHPNAILYDNDAISQYRTDLQRNINTCIGELKL